MSNFYKKTAANIFEAASVLMTSIITITVIFTFLFRLVGVSGSSMVPTLADRDWLITLTAVKDYKYKDIVIVVQPGALDEPLVKRVIATQGQWVDVRYDEGLVYVGDTKDSMQPLDEPYTAEKTTVHHYSDTNEYPIQVPEDCLFVMGDNRNNSTDSRSDSVGFIDENYVLGKAMWRIVSGESGIDFSKFKIYEG